MNAEVVLGCFGCFYGFFSYYKTMLQPDTLETPEWAIQTFEKLSGLQIVVHDLNAMIWPFLHPERLTHRSPCCTAVKARHDWACMDFEVTRLRNEILKSPEGRYHCCHAGFMEWVLPVFIQDRLAMILFAGQSKASGAYEHLAHDIRRTRHNLKFATELPRAKEEQAQTIMESLRQLRSRLLQWHDEASKVLQNPGGENPGDLSRMADRRLLIQRFVHQNHTGTATLQDLSAALKLGESRTSHLVRELFGVTYMQLLSRTRLRTAASLLRDTSLSILDVCLQSGFQDLSHFHRCFQKRFGTTPFKYRKLSHA